MLEASNSNENLATNGPSAQGCGECNSLYALFVVSGSPGRLDGIDQDEWGGDGDERADVLLGFLAG